jgi:hypothetical protein
VDDGGASEPVGFGVAGELKNPRQHLLVCCQFGIHLKTSSLVLTSIQWDTGPTASGVILVGIQWDMGPMASRDIIAGIQWDTGPTASGEILTGIQWDTGPTASGVILAGIQWDTGSSQKREWTSPARARIAPRGIKAATTMSIGRVLNLSIIVEAIEARTATKIGVKA